jgi:hypothetical protein
MGMVTLTIRDGQKPTKEQLKRIRAAARQPIVYTEDCPESTPQALAEFAAMARELRRTKKQGVFPFVAKGDESTSIARQIWLKVVGA